MTALDWFETAVRVPSTVVALATAELSIRAGRATSLDVTVYVGGEFTKVDGVDHNHIAAFSTATGLIDPSFQAYVGGTVWALAATNSAVYVGGSFTRAGPGGNAARSNLAAFDSAGSFLNWSPTTNPAGFVMSMVLSPDLSRVIVGGHFGTLNGAVAQGSGSVSATDGSQNMPWALNKTIADYTAGAAIDTLTSDGTLIYGGGYDFHDAKSSNFEGRFAADPTTGKIVWADSCYGDTYATLPIGPVLYSVSHDHDCKTVGAFGDYTPSYEPWHRTMAETTFPNGGVNLHLGRSVTSPKWAQLDGVPTAQVLDWFPILAPAPVTAPPGVAAVSGAAESGWSLTANAAGTYLAVGGEFLQANNAPQEGLVRFATRAIAPNKVGPVTEAGLATPTATAAATPGKVTVGWKGSWDRDNELLTYKVYRDDSAVAVYTTSAPSTFWQNPQFTFVDTGLSKGTHTYKLVTSDPDGNAIKASTTVKVTAGAPSTPPAATANLALGQTTSQSSVIPGHGSGQAVDGEVGTGITSAAMTESHPNSWWQVDLGASDSLTTIKVHGRTDADTGQSGNYDVFVSKAPFDPRLTPDDQAKQPGVFTYPQRTYPGPVLTITLPTGTTGRYVMVQHTNPNNANNPNNLTLTEVQVLGTPAAPPVDIARGRPATQSSTQGALTASLAVDGITNGSVANGTASATTASVDPWWQVDLGATNLIATMRVTAPTDGARADFASYWVFLANQPINTTLTPAQQSQVKGVYALHVTTAPNPASTLTFPKGASARYVMVQLDNPKALALQLAEVQIYQPTS